MITDVPSPAEFHAAGVNQIYLAWQIAMQATQDYEAAQDLTFGFVDDEIEEASADFWAKSQPALANAFSLVQQGMEMALKGRIAAISPYLLISRDPKDWPSGADKGPVSFSDFRTLDAADLVKVHNTFSSAPLDDAFRTFWDAVRRERNVLMHSVTPRSYDPAQLIRNILRAVEALFSEVRWPQRLFAMEAEGKYAAYGLSSAGDHNIVMAQVDTALRHLEPAEAKRFFGFDAKRRAYVCPICWHRADRDWQEDWPSLAQLMTKTRDETRLSCVVCAEVAQVERRDCINPSCAGNVIHEDSCLTCLWSQDSPDDFPSGLQSEDRTQGGPYSLRYGESSRTTYADDHFACDEDAIEHARRAMNAPNLQGWAWVEVRFNGNGLRSDVIGTWSRQDGDLQWKPLEEGPNPLFNLRASK